MSGRPKIVNGRIGDVAPFRCGTAPGLCVSTCMLVVGGRHRGRTLCIWHPLGVGGLQPLRSAIGAAQSYLRRSNDVQTTFKRRSNVQTAVFRTTTPPFTSSKRRPNDPNKRLTQPSQRSSSSEFSSVHGYHQNPTSTKSNVECGPHKAGQATRCSASVRAAA